MTCSVQGSTLIGLIHNRNHFFCFGKTARACFWPTAGFRPQPKLALFISNSTVHQYYYSHKTPQNQTLSFECIEDNFAFLSHWAVPMMDHSYRSKNDLKVKKKGKKKPWKKSCCPMKTFPTIRKPTFSPLHCTLRSFKSATKGHRLRSLAKRELWPWTSRLSEAQWAHFHSHLSPAVINLKMICNGTFRFTHTTPV